MPAAVICTSVIDARPIALRIDWARTLVPTYIKEIRHARRVEHRAVPLLSRYFFAWIEPDDVARVKRIRGVVDVLRRAGSDEPAYVPEHVIDCIGTVTRSDYTIGQALRVCKGRWDGLQGLFHGTDHDRVVLMVSMLGRDVKIPVNAADVEIPAA